MKKQPIFSLEDWDSILNYYRPNCSSKTWYLKELNQTHIPLTWGNWNLFNERGKLHNHNIIRNTITPDVFSSFGKYVTETDLNGSPHLYIIPVYEGSFFEKNIHIGFSCIKETYLDDVRKGKAKIIFYFLFEGHSGMSGNLDYEIIAKWMEEYKLPHFSVVFFTGNLMGDQVIKRKNLPFKVIPINVFDSWVCPLSKSKESPPYPPMFSPTSNKYLFLSYNRMPRLHRFSLVRMLLKYDLLDDGLLSFGDCNTTHKDVCKYATHVLRDKIDLDSKTWNEFVKSTPLTINKPINNNLAQEITINDYKETFASLVTETLSDTNTIFLSEKIWKPIYVGHPFFVLGSKGTLNYLRNMGFKTYSRWFDESYDKEESYIKRTEIIVKNLLQLRKYTQDELLKLRWEMMETCLYNQRLFMEKLRENWGEDGSHKTIKEEVLKIWDELISESPEKITQLTPKRLI